MRQQNQIGQSSSYEFAAEKATGERNGTLMNFLPDSSLFPKFRWESEFLEERIRYYTYLNAGLTLNFNGQKFNSKNGLLDLLTHHTDDTIIISYGVKMTSI